MILRNHVQTVGNTLLIYKYLWVHRLKHEEKKMDCQHYWEMDTLSHKKLCVYAVWNTDFEEEEFDELTDLSFL